MDLGRQLGVCERDEAIDFTRCQPLRMTETKSEKDTSQKTERDAIDSRNVLSTKLKSSLPLWSAGAWCGLSQSGLIFGTCNLNETESET